MLALLFRAPRSISFFERKIGDEKEGASPGGAAQLKLKPFRSLHSSHRVANMTIAARMSPLGLRTGTGHLNYPTHSRRSQMLWESELGMLPAPTGGHAHATPCAKQNDKVGAGERELEDKAMANGPCQENASTSLMGDDDFGKKVKMILFFFVYVSGCVCVCFSLPSPLFVKPLW